MNFHAVSVQNTLDVAKVFANIEGVSAVEVVGSVARNKRGNDLDLVVVVDWYMYLPYMLRLARRLSDEYWTDADYYTDVKDDRLTYALDALHAGAAERGWLELATKNVPLDLHLMPIGWKAEASNIQALFNFSDAYFVRNIAKDAVTLARRSNTGTGLCEVDWP